MGVLPNPVMLAYLSEKYIVKILCTFSEHQFLC